jgi:hypothetical protein
MTPGINFAVANCPVADELITLGYMWFDVDHGVKREPRPQVRLPYPHNAVALSYWDEKIGKRLYSALVITVSEPVSGSDNLRVHALINLRVPVDDCFLCEGTATWDGDAYDFELGFVDRTLNMYAKQAKQDAETARSHVASLIAKAVDGICAQAGVTGHTATANAANAKRVAKGKKPLYDWHTVALAPRPPKSEPKGGTHASPRPHDRRGHYRTYKSGKQVWVRNTRVGKGEGFVFKDYVVRPSTNVLDSL